MKNYKRGPIDPERERELECIAMACLQMMPPDLDEMLFVKERFRETFDRWVQREIDNRRAKSASVSYLRPVERA